jgi:hypothetical protein
MLITDLTPHDFTAKHISFEVGGIEKCASAFPKIPVG